LPVNFMFPLLEDVSAAENKKNGNEKSIRSASKVTASTSVSRYASFTTIAFVEKQIAPARPMITPPRKYPGEGFLERRGDANKA
jgi:hypothetical protein